MPPTFAAARNTYGGCCSAKKRSTAAADLRSSSARVRSSSRLAPAARSWRTMAEPTRPLCPATKIDEWYTDPSFSILVDLETVTRHDCIALCQFQVLGDHLGHQRLKIRFRRPTELVAGLAGITQQRFDLGWAEVSRVDLYDRATARGIDAALFDAVALPLEAHAHYQRGTHGELAHRVLFAGGNHKVLGFGLLQHEPLRTHVVTRMAPITHRVEITQKNALIQPLMEARQSARDFARHKGLAADRRLVVEQDAIARIQTICFAIIDRDPIRVHLGGAVRRARIERGSLPLRDFLDLAEHFRGGGLIKAGRVAQPQNADCLEHTQRPEGIGICRVFGCFERHADVALRREVVDLVRLDLLDNADQVAGVGQITVVEVQAHTALVRILIQMVNAFGVEGRSAPLD